MSGGKVLISAILLFVLSSSFIQSQDALKQGVYYLSGGIGFSSSNNEVKGIYGSKTKSTTFIVQPSFSYFIMDRLSIGPDFSFVYSEYEEEYNYYYESYYNNSYKRIFRHYGVGADLRYYFPGTTVVPLIGVSGSYYKSGGHGNYQEGNDFTTFVGLNYFISRNAALEPYISYSMSSYNKPEQTSNAFAIGFRMNYFIVD